MRWNAAVPRLSLVLAPMLLSSACEDYLYLPTGPTPIQVDHYAPPHCSASLTVYVIDLWDGFPVVDPQVSAIDDYYGGATAWTDGRGVVDLLLTGEVHHGACVRGVVSVSRSGYYRESQPYDLGQGHWGELFVSLEPW